MPLSSFVTRTPSAPLGSLGSAPAESQAPASRSISGRIVALVALLSALGAGLVGCAEAPRDATVPNTAVLEVANRTSRPQDVFLDGQRLGRVAPGARVRFHALPAADVRLLAQPPDGGVTDDVRAALIAGVPFVWSIQGDGEVLPEPPGLGAIALTNGIGRDVEVYLDDRRVASLFADGRRVLSEVPAGPHTLEAVSPSDGRRVRRTLDVIPDAVTPWTVVAPMGTLKVFNEWNEAAVILVSGLDCGTIQPGDTLVIPNRFAGPLSVEAQGARTRAVAREALDVRAGEVTEWHLAESGGAVSVINRANETLAVEIDGVGKGLVAPLDELHVDDLPPGKHVITVGGADTGVRLSREVRLGTGERAVWAVDPRFGAVRVVNTSPEVQLVYLDGAPRYELPSGDSVTLDDVPIGPHTLAAVGTTSRTRQDHPVHARAEASATWWLRGSVGTVVVDNRREEALRVYIDARYRGVVEPGQVMTLDEVAAGARLAEAVGQDSARVFRERIDVPPGDPAVWTVRDPSARLAIENLSGEVLRAGGTLAAQASHVAPGTRFTFRLPPGARRVALVGADTGFVYALETTLVDGESAAWSVTPPKGAVVVYNRSGEPLRLSLDGEPIGTLAPNDDIVLDAVRAGRHTVQGQGALSGAALRWPFVLAADARARWEVGPQFAQVRVDNRTDEALSIAVDGQVWGRAEPGGLLQLARLAPGVRAFEARGERTGIRYGSEMHVQVARVAVWQVLPAEGTLVVTTSRPDPMEVSIDGTPIGTTTGPGDPVTGRAAAGGRLVEARALTPGGTDFRAPQRVGPDRTSEVHIPPETVRLDVVNDTPWTVRVFAAEKLSGEVPAGATLRIPGVPPRVAVDLRAVTEDGAHLWRRTVTVPSRESDGGPDEVWRLLPPPVQRPTPAGPPAAAPAARIDGSSGLDGAS